MHEMKWYSRNNRRLRLLQSGAIICTNWGSRSKSTNCLSWWSSGSSNGQNWSYTIGKGPTQKASSKIKRLGRSVSQRRMPRKNRQASTHNDWWKANWWNKYQQVRSRRTWNDEVWFFLKGSEPRRRIEEFFFFGQDGHGVMNVDFFFLAEFSRLSFFFFFSGFRTHVVATTVVCDGGCTYTHLLHAHVSAHSACTVTSTLLMRVTYTHGSSSLKKVFVAWVSLLSISSSPFLCRTHLLLSPYDSLSLSRLSRPHVLAVLNLSWKRRAMRISARETRRLAVRPSPLSTQVVSPTSSTRSLLWTVTRCSLTMQTSMKSPDFLVKHTQEHWTVRCSHNVLNPQFRTFLMMILLFK